MNEQERLNLVVEGLIKMSEHIVAGLDPFTPPPPLPPPLPPVSGGWGSDTVGGEGKPERIVFNLNPSGPGSLRQAIDDSAGEGGDIQFVVSGYYDMSSDFVLKPENSFLTFDGSQAPGPVVLRGAGGSQAMFDTEGARELIFQDFIIRRGKGTRSAGKAFKFGSSTEKVIVRRVPTGWGWDNSIGFTNARHTFVRDILITDMLIAENFRGHSTGLNVVGSDDGRHHDIERIEIHRVVFATVGHRNPLVSAGSVRVSNCLVYNWGNRIGGATRDSVCDWINNYFLAGPATGSGMLLNLRRQSSGLGDPSIYHEGNLAPGRGFDTIDADGQGNWTMWQNRDTHDSLPTSMRRTTPLPDAPSIVSAQAAFDELKLGNFLTKDIEAERIFAYIQNNSGPSSMLDSEADVGGFKPL